MALSTGDIHVVVGGNVLIAGLNDGNGIHVTIGKLVATTLPVNYHEEIIDATGPGDAGIFKGYSGNRRFQFELQGKYTRGTFDLHGFTKSNAAMDLAFDTGDHWKGNAIITSVVKEDGLIQYPDFIPIKLTGYISGFNY